MADTIIVGQFLGEDALAAVGATGSTVYLVIGFASGLTQGCGILVSQAFGGHRLNELKKVVGTALLLTVVFSVILTIPTVSFSRQILLALHTQRAKDTGCNIVGHRTQDTAKDDAKIFVCVEEYVRRGVQR